MKLRQVMTPADQASWTEFFYNGELRITKGVAETDNPNWIDQLKVRGFREIQEEEAIVIDHVVAKANEATLSNEHVTGDE